MLACRLTTRCSRRPKTCSLRSRRLGFPRCARPPLSANVRRPGLTTHVRMIRCASSGTVTKPRRRALHHRCSGIAEVALPAVGNGGKSIGVVAGELDLTESAVRAWVRQTAIEHQASRRCSSAAIRAWRPATCCFRSARSRSMISRRSCSSVRRASMRRSACVIARYS